MTIRRTMKARGGMTAVAITTGLVLAVAGCSSGGDGGDDGRSPALLRSRTTGTAAAGDGSGGRRTRCWPR